MIDRAAGEVERGQMERWIEGEEGWEGKFGSAKCSWIGREPRRGGVKKGGIERERVRRQEIS